MPNVALIPHLATRIDELTAVLDGVQNTTHRLQTRTGTAPQEDGARITDHAVAQPPSLTLVVYVSNRTGTAGERPADAWETLRRLHREVTPMTVLTPWGTYTDMLLKRATGQQQGLGLRARLELEQIVRVGLNRDAIVTPTAFGPATERTQEVARGRVAPQVLESTPFIAATRQGGLAFIPVAQQLSDVQGSEKSWSDRYAYLRMLADKAGGDLPVAAFAQRVPASTLPGLGGQLSQARQGVGSRQDRYTAARRTVENLLSGLPQLPF